MKRCFIDYLMLTIISVTFYTCSNSNQTSRLNNNRENLLCDLKKTHSVYKKKNFDSVLNSITAGRKEGLDYPEELLYDSAFVEIFAHSYNYFDDVVKLLRKGQFTDDQASHCIYAMQNLCLDDYIGLSKIYLNLYSTGKISEGMLEECITPSFLKIRIIEKNYDDPRVIEILNSILNRNISKNFKTNIQNILSDSYL